MIKERLRELFGEYDPTLRAIIIEVVQLEQENISKERPHLKTQIDEIIIRAAKKRMAQEAEDNTP